MPKPNATDAMTDFQKALLTPEERAALEEDAEPEEQKARKASGNFAEGKLKDKPEAKTDDQPAKVDAQAAEDADDDDAGEDDGADSADPAVEDAGDGADPEIAPKLSKAELAALAKEEKDAAEAAENAASLEPDEEEAAAIVVARTNQPVLVKRQVPEVPKDIKAQLTTLDEQIAELDTKLDDGELSTLEYRQQIRAVQAKIDDLRDLEREASRITRDNAEGEDALWKWQVNKFVGEDMFPQYKKSKLLWGALNQAVIDYSAMPESAGKDGFDLLMAAHKMVQRDLGVAIAPPAKAAEPKPAAPKPKSGVQTSKSLKGIPASLGEVPSADASETGRDRFAAIDALADDPDRWEEFERALAQMSPADAAAYRQAA